jgi:septal ring factor EnvC (AmiA/AmiB activator)
LACPPAPSRAGAGRARSRRPGKLNALVELQTQRLEFLRRTYRLALHRLELRIVQIYELGQAETLDIILSATSFSEVVDQVEFTQRIKEQDARIAAEVKHTRNEARAPRAHTKATRVRVAAVTRTIQVRAEQVRALHDSLVAQENALSSARAEKQQSVSGLKESLKEMLAEADSLEQSSAALAEKIQAAQSSGSYTPSARASLLERPHGYGNLIVIDHGGGLATAYAHQSSFAVGTRVSQGQVIGHVGCTGRCFGPHLHFEVRVNGAAVDPLGYL